MRRTPCKLDDKAAVDTIVFDIGNVLAAFDWEGFVKKFGFGKEIEERIARAVFKNPDWAQVDLGIKSDEELIEAFIANDPGLEREIRDIFERWQYSVEEYPYAAAWVKALKDAGYKVYILSNYGRTMFAYAKDRFEFLKHVDGGVVSYEINKIKPEPGIYRALIDKYSIVPGKAVFLDDLAANLDGAEAFGFNTVLVTSREAAVYGLEKLGIYC